MVRVWEPSMVRTWIHIAAARGQGTEPLCLPLRSGHRAAPRPARSPPPPREDPVLGGGGSAYAGAGEG